RLAADAVQPLVLVLERGDHGVQVGGVVDVDLDLPRLPAVAELGRADELDAVQPLLQLVEDDVELGSGDRTRVEVARPHFVELRPRVEQPERAEQSGERGADTLRPAGLPARPRSVRRPAPAAGTR